MASTGAEAWRKHFQPVFATNEYLDTVVNKDCNLFDSNNNNMMRVTKGTPVIVAKTDTYNEKTPVALKSDPATTYYITFNNLQKPKSKSASGIKLKPQDFPSVRFNLPISVEEFANAIKKDLADNRPDLDPSLNMYLTELVNYWSGATQSTQSIREAYKGVTEGKAETAKDFGEILGAMACVKKGILSGVRVSGDTRIKLPSAGNAPLADYFLVNNSFPGGQLTISAKSGSTTNTLKPKDILNLLKESNKEAQWSAKPIYKFMQLVVDTSTVYFPFAAINLVAGKNILNSKALEKAKLFNQSNFSGKNYDMALLGDLFNLLGFKITNQPTLGQLFYETEKYVVSKANEIYPPTDIFEAATSGAVTYVKYSISDSKPEGTFEILVNEAAKVDKKNIKWRSKNSTNRAADKIGLQP